MEEKEIYVRRKEGRRKERGEMEGKGMKKSRGKQGEMEGRTVEWMGMEGEIAEGAGGGR
jgi:hypothetical protein